MTASPLARWPDTPDELIALQLALGQAESEPWEPGPESLAVGGCFACFVRGGPSPGQPGDPGWAGAALLVPGRPPMTVVAQGQAGAAYEGGLLALREGPLLEGAVRQLPHLPDVLLVDATGRDHLRRAGMALHLGAVLGIPTVGVTHRPLLAQGPWPEDRPGAASPLTLGGEQVGYWLRTRAGTRPLAVHAGWRAGPEAAVAVVLASLSGFRTPEPIARARQAARLARAQATKHPST